MITIRIFKIREEAEKAQNILSKGGIFAEIPEDTFNGVPIQEYGVTARFRLLVNNTDFYRATEYLAKKLMSRRVPA